MGNKLTAFIGGGARTRAVKKMKALVEGAQRRQAARVLEGMSDRMLADIGVRRHEIRNRVFNDN